jgi:hypothetical protein
MNINYLILAHTQPIQVRRLVDRLEGPTTRFYINVDANVDLAPFEEVLRGSTAVLYLLPDEERYATPWGDIGLVNATLHLMQMALIAGKSGYCILLSGQDYPLRSNREICDFLSQRPDTDYLESYKLPSNRWSQGGLNRINAYKFNLSTRREDAITLPSIFDRQFYKRSVAKSWVKALSRGKFIMDRKLLRRRQFPSYLDAYGGEHWWALTTDTVRKIFTFLEAHPDYMTYHRDTLLVEEIFIHSIVNFLHREQTDKIANKVTYANWDVSRSKSGPDILGLADLPRLRSLSKQYLFARKFAIDKDEAILNALDAQLGVGPAGQQYEALDQ